MWQLLVGAAVAGSTSLLAKHLFSPNANNPTSGETPNCNQDQSPGLESRQDETQAHGSEEKCESQEQDGIFRFSSPGSRGNKAGSSSRRKRVVQKTEKRSSGVGVSRRVNVCLKRRKTAMNVDHKCGSCAPKDSSVFSWGLGVGIMCMMSAGKAEINKLNSTVDETAKVVEELKTELCRRKTSRKLQASSISNEVSTISQKLSGSNAQFLLDTSKTGNRDPNDVKTVGVPMIEDAECASSVLTEEQEPEQVGPEMDQLVAELESELQKLSEGDNSAEELYEPMVQSPHASHGVLPSELDQKLCHVLIERQENQIVELESELHLAQSKLHEKEAELQALKDCVKRLTEFSLSTVSEDENEAREEQHCAKEWDQHSKIESESRKLIVGMKRHMEP